MKVWLFPALACAFLMTTGAASTATEPFQGFQIPDYEPGLETESQVFQKAPSKLSKQSEQVPPESPGGQKEGQSSEESSRESSSVTTTIGILSTVFPFNTSAVEGGNQTYLRLINPESFSNEITVSVFSIDFADQFVLEGSCFISVPGKSAPQLGNEYFEDCIGWTPTSSQVVMFLQFDAGDYLYWQNVIWSPTTGYFGNLSTCREPTVSDQFIHSVHTSKISGYPSTLFGLIDVSEPYYVDVNIYDGGSGSLIGQYRSQLFSSNTVLLALEVATLEQFATWFIPFADRPLQINLEFDLVNQFGIQITQGRADLVSHYVQQTSRGETYNMLNVCSF
ncbi:MAG: hypothetical protein GKS03_11040 [Alphaproteobacteria bacterium]|nr:hypothetical protein [Alphaproteobacteria bacterium]